MSSTFDKGIAFICEGSTEKVFYLELLSFLCRKRNAEMERVIDADGEALYILQTNKGKYGIKIRVASAISALPKSGNWFEMACAEMHKKVKWLIFLCYDTDSPSYDISQFREGDWKELRTKLNGKNNQVIDLAAAAEIEDIMLVDCPGICKYLGCTPIQSTELHGRKGSAKMKLLFRNCGKSYHKGERAQEMIQALDFDKIISSGILPLYEIDNLF